MNMYEAYNYKTTCQISHQRIINGLMVKHPKTIYQLNTIIEPLLLFFSLYTFFNFLFSSTHSLFLYVIFDA